MSSLTLPSGQQRRFSNQSIAIFAIAMRQLSAFVVLAIVVLFADTSTASAQTWLTEPSYFTHNPESGERVTQYQRNDRVVHSPTATRSVYRHIRSTLQVGDSVDYYHAVDQYGGPVRPYGEWRFPFRPFSAPYSQWGPNFNNGYNSGWGSPGWGYPGWGGGNGWGSPYGRGGIFDDTGFSQQWTDGYYPDVQRDRYPPRQRRGRYPY